MHMATGNMQKESLFGELQPCDFRVMVADRQTDRLLITTIRAPTGGGKD